ncbi:MAG: hypothetical protein H7Z42_19795 [Roseiflexaceae bacterium]|nr:hypothetical protein [Roseiflexaceae bacterium]
MTINKIGDPQALSRQIMEATNNLTDEQASQRYQQILAQLPPDQAEDLNAMAMSQVGQTERHSLAAQLRQANNDPDSPFDGYDYDDDDEAASPASLGRMSLQAQQQDPRLLGGMLGGQQSGLGGQIGKAALSALAALLIRRMMSGQAAGSSSGLPAQGGLPSGQPMPGGLDLGSILGGLLGGGAGGQPMPSSQSIPGGDLGSILGGLLGGGAGGPSQGLPPRAGQPMPNSQPMPGGLDLGSILGGLLGGGAISRQSQQGGDLGSILGSILSGAPQDVPTPASEPAKRSHRR